ncbi:MAG: DUF2802 domain-containing protein [Gammaproteobacteria bacterium]|nr:DUF2802 domain-containing protein [Gammaproteobacteria bacterium]
MYDTLFYGIAIIALLFSNALLIMLGFMVARFRSPVAEQESERETPPNLHQEIKSISLSLAALGERLVKLEIQIGQLRDQAGQQALPLNRGDAEQKSFKVATKLALQGASADEIVELCGLTRGEADLICMLHSSNQVSPNGVANGDFKPQKVVSRVPEFYDNVGQDVPDSDQV